MLNFLKQLHRRALDQDGESATLLALMQDVRVTVGNHILDVGCGYGRNLRPLVAAGLSATGVEINPDIVAANRRDGLDCLSVDEFRQSTNNYDAILMAHVIEHFAPADLLVFMDGYLDRLRPGGRLVIATPLMSHYFYDDFDHVKPYQPAGIQMVFGKGAQVQYYSRNKLELLDLRYRRSPLRLSHARSRFIRSPLRFVLMATDLVSGAAYWVSGGLIGRVDGWIGVFEKVGESV